MGGPPKKSYQLVCEYVSEGGLLDGVDFAERGRSTPKGVGVGRADILLCVRLIKKRSKMYASYF